MFPPVPSSEETLFADALRLPEGQRHAFIEERCNHDPAAVARVMELLRGYAQNSDFLERPLMQPPAPASPETRAGDNVGPYKLLQSIGEGGFGVVWLAEQREPVRRRVALKIIKLGMDTKEVIARFEAERQALAMMDHPNIARVLDAGSTATGRPYFVMELVRGVPITHYCDDTRLPTPARVRLFISVCQAVQHAHQKGVIHRDLKPSNILITLHDGIAVPKIIDFGIAKAIDARLTDKTLITQFHAFIGTPAYTSPEQMEMSGLDVDTRSDIYSLGVLLYELLAGRPPFDADALVKSGLDAMRRTVREVDPPRPSHRLGTLAAADRTTVARQRGTEPMALSLLLRGDLDWIVMRCLEKDRTRRYETANGLAADLERHLRDEVVVARPPSTAYRIHKFVRRHRIGVASAAAVTVLLVAGLLVSSVLLMRERAAHTRALAAEHQEGVLRQEAEDARATEMVRASRTASELASQFFAEGRTAEGLAFLVHAARKDPHNPTLAPRLASALTLHNFLLPVQEPLNFPAAVVHVGYIEDGRRISVYCEDGTIGFIDTATGGHVRTRLPAPLASDGVLLTGRVTLVRGTDDVIRVLDSATGRIEREFTFERSILWITARNSDRPIFIILFEDHSSVVVDAITGSIRTLPFSASAVHHAVSVDGRWLARSSSALEWELWDLRTGERRATRSWSGEPIRITFSLDGTRLATAYGSEKYDYGFQLWSVPDALPIADPQYGQRWAQTSPFAQTFSPDGRWICISTAHSQQVYDTTTGEPVGPLLATGILNTSSPTDSMRAAAAVGFNGFSGRFRGPIFCGSPDRPRLVTRNDVEGRRGLIVRDLFTGESVLPLLPHPGAISDLRSSDDGTKLLTVGDDGAMRLWDLSTGQLMAEPSLQLNAKDMVVALSRDGRELVTSGAEGIVYRMKVGPGAARPLVLPRSEPYVPAPFLPDSPTRVMWLKPDRAMVVDVASGNKTTEGFVFPELITGGTQGQGLAFRQDLGFMVARTVAGVWQTWELDGSGVARVVPLESAPDTNGWVTLSAAGDTLAMIPDDDRRAVRLWNLRTGRSTGTALVYPAPLLTGNSQPARFSADGRRLIAGSANGMAKIWDTTTGAALVRLQPLRTAPVRCVDFSADGTRVATLNDWGEAQLWDASTGRPVALIAEKGKVAGVVFSPGGEYLLTWSDHGGARVWDAQSGSAVSEPMRHPNTFLRRAAFSPDSRRIVTGGGDGAARIWDARTGQPVSEPMWHDVRVVDCEFSPDGRFVRTEQASVPPHATTFSVWAVPPDAANAPAPDWLLQLATICATKVVNDAAQGIDVPEVIGDLNDVRRQLAALPDDAPFAAWGRWFLDDRVDRPIAPGFTLTAAQADRLAAELRATKP